MRTLTLLLITVAVAGCSKAASPPAANVASAVGNGADGASLASAAPAAAPAGDGCGGHMVGQADVQPLLTGPITSVKLAPSDPDSCVFSTSGFSSISVTVRPGQGKQTLESWHKGPVTTLAGVGDDAVWEAGLQEVVASKNDTLCTVTAMGSEVTPATAETEGALCNKIFAGL